MKVLLVEDDEIECAIYKEIIKNKEDIKLVDSTNSSKEAIKYVKNYKPDAVILDLELTNGEGSGFEFIEDLKKLKLNKRPKIVVTTNIYSDSVYNFLHKNKVDFIFYKNQVNYSHNNVLNILLLLNEYEEPNKLEKIELDNNSENEKLSNLINNELDLIGVASHLKGRKCFNYTIFS